MGRRLSRRPSRRHTRTMTGPIARATVSPQIRHKYLNTLFAKHAKPLVFRANEKYRTAHSGSPQCIGHRYPISAPIKAIGQWIQALSEARGLALRHHGSTPVAHRCPDGRSYGPGWPPPNRDPRSDPNRLARAPRSPITASSLSISTYWLKRLSGNPPAQRAETRKTS